MGQSASFQSNYLSTFPDACQYLKALLKLRISRVAFSGSRACEEARPLPRTIQSEQQRAEAEQLCGFLPPRSCPASRSAPPHRVPERAARAGAAAAKLGCENGLRRTKKRFSVSRRAQSTEGRPRRRQRQPRQQRELGRIGTGCRGCAWVTPRAGGERGGGAAAAVPWAGPCSHHLGDAEGTGYSGRFADTRTPPRRPQPRTALTISPDPSPAGARASNPELLAAGTLEPKLLEGGCPQLWLVLAADRQLPTTAERGAEDAAADGSDGSRGSPSSSGVCNV